MPRIALVLLGLVVALSACSRTAPDEPVAATPPAPVPAEPVAPIPPPPPRELPDDATSLAAADRAYLIGQGLGEPEAELIECKGAVGGTPGFHDPEGIHILGRDSARAVFDDGHDQGTVDLSFTVRRGKIDWDVEKIECGGGARVANAGKP